MGPNYLYFCIGPTPYVSTALPTSSWPSTSPLTSWKPYNPTYEVVRSKHPSKRPPVPAVACGLAWHRGDWCSLSSDAGNPLVQQLGRYLTDGWPKSPEAQAKCGDGQQTGRDRPWRGHKVDQTNRAQQSLFRRFSTTPKRFTVIFLSSKANAGV
jgi:hypothetical protein